LSGDSENIEDLRRLTGPLERVEKLLTLAASLHRKLLKAPRLSREIFSDYYNFYIQTTAMGFTEDIDEKVRCSLVDLGNIPIFLSIELTCISTIFRAIFT